MADRGAQDKSQLLQEKKVVMCHLEAFKNMIIKTAGIAHQKGCRCGVIIKCVAPLWGLFSVPDKNTVDLIGSNGIMP
jgi:hypothetical protein